ncbi:lipoyl protein ligase domain-containing protein [Dyadobacter frigoris]|uniref:lipoyl(octanoyl) transferase n=1 Tax=Dyadobacter frigoris TaxID=2576211 RepID=A0A4V6BJB2_9BACT|nr:hypothetical protein [Dyadobacter frigoris]TKT93383.1 hypothetical protein FDK13_05900 [Dyadobacter frigoris]GLU54696.1 hypothetical protein Dfri01_41570 [Dyadobacter frigoris]
MQNTKVFYQDWGMIDYKAAWEIQEDIFASVIKLKRDLRSLAPVAPGDLSIKAIPVETPNYLIFCEHSHVFTLGRTGSANHLLLDNQGLKKKRAVFYPINRGGDITYHGPGQLVCYPILDLDNFYTKPHNVVCHRA